MSLQFYSICYVSLPNIDFGFDFFKKSRIPESYYLTYIYWVSPPKKCAHPVELITPYKAAKKTLQSPNDGQMNKNLGAVVGDLDKQQWNCPSLSRAMFLPWSTGSILRYGPATALGEEGKPWVSLPTTTWAAWQTCLHLQECHLDNTWLHLSQWFDNKKRRSAIADGFIPFKRLGCIFIAHVDLDAKVFLTLRSSLLLTQP